ncbi:general substrate transporter [Phycomyces nitens]|nr:general substrate transporter [Phycomyces nitens]
MGFAKNLPFSLSAQSAERQPLLQAIPSRPAQGSTHSSFPKMPFWTAAATCISCLGGFLFGFDLGVVGGLLIAPSFLSYFGIDPNNKEQEANISGNVVSILQVGCLIGALLATSTADRLGRKYSIIIAAAIFTIGGIVQVIGYSLAVLYVGRLVAGLGVGALSMLVPIYVAEVAHHKHRGFLGGLWMFFIATGLASSYWTNYAVKRLVDSNDNSLWRIPLIIQTAPGLIMLFGMMCLFETPRWLAAHGRTDESLEVLAKVRGLPQDHKEVVEELKALTLAFQQGDQSMTWKTVLGPENRRRLLTGCAIQFFQQMTGTNVVNYYSPIIFRSIGLSSGESELLATGVYGLVKMVTVLVGFSLLVDRFGRRPLLVWGGTGMGACLLSVAACVASRPMSIEEQIAPSAYAGIVCMFVFAVFFSVSWGPVPWLYCSEIYPMRMRAKSASITTAINWSLNALIGKISPLMLAKSTIGTYSFFGGCCILMSLACHFIIPETKGKSLEEMEALFRPTHKIRDSNKGLDGKDTIFMA